MSTELDTAPESEGQPLAADTPIPTMDEPGQKPRKIPPELTFKIPEPAYSIDLARKINAQVESYARNDDPMSAYYLNKEHADFVQTSRNRAAFQFRYWRTAAPDRNSLASMDVKNTLAANDPVQKENALAQSLVRNPFFGNPSYPNEREYLSAFEYNDRMLHSAQRQDAPGVEEAATMVSALPLPAANYARNMMRARGVNLDKVAAARQPAPASYVRSMVVKSTIPGNNPTAQLAALSTLTEESAAVPIDPAHRAMVDEGIMSILNKPILDESGQNYTTLFEFVNRMDAMPDSPEKSRIISTVMPGKEGAVAWAKISTDMKDKSQAGLANTIHLAKDSIETAAEAKAYASSAIVLANDSTKFAPTDVGTEAVAFRAQLSGFIRSIAGDKKNPDAFPGITNLNMLRQLSKTLEAEKVNPTIKDDGASIPGFSGAGSKGNRTAYIQKLEEVVNNRISDLVKNPPKPKMPVVTAPPAATPVAGTPAPVSGEPGKAPAAPVVTSDPQTNALVAQFMKFTPEQQKTKREELLAITQNKDVDMASRKVASNILFALPKDETPTSGEAKNDWNAVFAPAMLVVGGMVTGAQALATEGISAKVTQAAMQAGAKKWAGVLGTTSGIGADALLVSVEQWAVRKVAGDEVGDAYLLGQGLGGAGYGIFKMGKAAFTKYVPAIKNLRQTYKTVSEAGVPSKELYDAAIAIRSETKNASKIVEEQADRLAAFAVRTRKAKAAAVTAGKGKKFVPKEAPITDAEHTAAKAKLKELLLKQDTLLKKAVDEHGPEASTAILELITK